LFGLPEVDPHRLALPGVRRALSGADIMGGRGEGARRVSVRDLRVG
jgi:hypothetical protein